jgi:hypothetical protein
MAIVNRIQFFSTTYVVKVGRKRIRMYMGGKFVSQRGEKWIRKEPVRRGRCDDTVDIPYVPQYHSSAIILYVLVGYTYEQREKIGSETERKRQPPNNRLCPH